MFIDLEREEGRKTEIVTERNVDWLPSARAPAGYRTHSLGMCPD